MTREEARKAVEVINAYADGKEIQYAVRSVGQGWKDLPEGETPKFNFSAFYYRIKPEPAYRAFKSKDECLNEMMKHHPFGLLYETIPTIYVNINTIENLGISCGKNTYDYNIAFVKFNFADGEPFGIRKE